MKDGVEEGRRRRREGGVVVVSDHWNNVILCLQMQKLLPGTNSDYVSCPQVCPPLHSCWFPSLPDHFYPLNLHLSPLTHTSPPPPLHLTHIVCYQSALPFVGFGFLDNFIMIAAVCFHGNQMCVCENFSLIRCSLKSFQVLSCKFPQSCETKTQA